MIYSILFLLLLSINVELLHAGYPMYFGGKRYEINAQTSKPDLYIDKFSQLSDSSTVIVSSTGNFIINTSTVIGNQVFNVSSGTTKELSVTTGSIKMVNANIEMNGNIVYLSADKKSYIYYDEVNKWIRTFMDGIEYTRLKQ